MAFAGCMKHTCTGKSSCQISWSSSLILSTSLVMWQFACSNAFSLQTVAMDAPCMVLANFSRVGIMLLMLQAVSHDIVASGSFTILAVLEARSIHGDCSLCCSFPHSSLVSVKQSSLAGLSLLLRTC